MNRTFRNTLSNWLPNGGGKIDDLHKGYTHDFIFTCPSTLTPAQPRRLTTDTAVDRPRSTLKEPLFSQRLAAKPNSKVSKAYIEIEVEKSKLDVTTDLQAFRLIVTAEPYFAVSQPSDVVVLENVVRKDTVGKVEEIDASYELLERGQYVSGIDTGGGSERDPDSRVGRGRSVCCGNLSKGKPAPQSG